MLSVTKSFSFAYAHLLPDYPGNCSKLHGHTGTLEVEVSDGPDATAQRISHTNYPGMVIDFGDLKRLVQTKVLDCFDHCFLNDLLQVPTVEKMVRWAVKQLQEVLGDSLVRVRIYETPTSYAEWKKDA